MTNFGSHKQLRQQRETIAYPRSEAIETGRKTLERFREMQARFNRAQAGFDSARNQLDDVVAKKVNQLRG